jgi:hypothetical protein
MIFNNWYNWYNYYKKNIDIKLKLILNKKIKIMNKNKNGWINDISYFENYFNRSWINLCNYLNQIYLSYIWIN